MQLLQRVQIQTGRQQRTTCEPPKANEKKNRRFPDTANANALRWVSYCCRPVNTKCMHGTDIKSVVVTLEYAERNQITSNSIEIRKHFDTRTNRSGVFFRPNTAAGMCLASRASKSFCTLEFNFKCHRQRNLHLLKA